MKQKFTTMKSNVLRVKPIGRIQILLIVLVTFDIGCSKDDPEPKVFINTQETQVSFTEVNKCHVGGGVYYTRFNFTIPYESSPDIEIAAILYSAEGTSEMEEDDFNDTGTSITFDLCLKFGGATSVNFTTKLVSTDDIKSSPRTVIINKPTGAN
jgi:hypothetical protein